MLHWALLIAHCTQTRRTHKHTQTPCTHTHRHPVHTLPAHTHIAYSLYTRTAGINTRKKEYIVYITCQSELRQKSRQIKTYLVVIYGNAYTPCWPAAEQQNSSSASASFRFICLHNSRPFVCTAVRLSVCLLLAFLSLLFPHLPSPALPHSPPAQALSVCVCACCCCCSCAHALFRATFAFAQIKRNFGNFETIFHATLFSFSLSFSLVFFPSVLFSTDFTALAFVLPSALHKFPSTTRSKV